MGESGVNYGREMEFNGAKGRATKEIKEINEEMHLVRALSLMGLSFGSQHNLLPLKRFLKLF